ncbi:MAG: hypothetical protein GX387_13855 [Clostridium sp.]|nr:hypothetical protein [Clostridium sp.]
MLLSRADEYLFGNDITPEFVEHVIDRRISDIGKIAKAKREDVAKGFLKGFMKGYYNGKCSPSRELRGTKKITRKGALNVIEMVKNKDLRAKISPDGQLIRTTNLPKSADKFPYILANYPNSFYDWQLEYEYVKYYVYNNEVGRHVLTPYVYLKEYAPPVDLDKVTKWDNFKEIKDEYIQSWEDKVRDHLELILNVDYRTIDEEWADKVFETDYYYYTDVKPYIDLAYKRMELYMDGMKANKTIVESEIVATDKSTLYFSDRLMMRAYIKFRIVSSEEQTEDSITKNIFYVPGSDAIIEDVKLGEWTEWYIDVYFDYFGGLKTIGVQSARVAPVFKYHKVK